MLLIRFAVPAAIAAAGILTLFADLPAWATWHLADVEHQITPVKAVIGTVIIAFAALELSPAFARLALPARYLILGGLIGVFRRPLRQPGCVPFGLSDQGRAEQKPSSAPESPRR